MAGIIAQVPQLDPHLSLAQQVEASICSLLLTAPPLCWRSYLVAGSSDGMLYIVPGDVDHTVAQPQISTYPVSADTEAPVEALAYGRILQQDFAEIVAISADGTLVIFRTPMSDGRPATKVHQQMIQANVKAAYITDIDGDNQVELVCVLTDRVVRTFRWNPQDKRMIPIKKWEVPAQISALGIGLSRTDLSSQMILSQMGETYFVNVPLSGHGKVSLTYPRGVLIKNHSVMTLPWKTEFAAILGCQVEHAVVRPRYQLPDHNDRELVNSEFPLLAVATMTTPDYHFVATLDIRGLVQLYAFDDKCKEGSLHPIGQFETEPDSDHLVVVLMNPTTLLFGVANVYRYMYLYTLPLDKLTLPDGQGCL